MLHRDMNPQLWERLALHIGHNCRNLGCNLPHCELCRNNPERRCQTHFRQKYVDNARLVFTAWCKELILARIVYADSERVYVEEPSLPSALQGVYIQMFLLEGQAYDSRVEEVGVEGVTNDDFESMALLDNNSSGKPEPLLVPGRDCPGYHTTDNRLMVPLLLNEEGTPILVRTSRSSQSAQGGRTRPFRLLARCVWEDGTPVPYITPDVSEPFVVTTRRTKTAEKAQVPKWGDSVSKLPGVGKETLAKLRDLRAHGLTTPLANYRILTVGDLHDLVDGADGALLQDLGRALGVKHDKVEELQRCARLVARPDARKRVWGSRDFPAERLLFPCADGVVDFAAEHIEVIRDTNDAAEIISTDLLSPEDLYRVNMMRDHAQTEWWAPYHPGWGIFEEPGQLQHDEGVPDLMATVSLRDQMEWQDKRSPHPEGEAAELGLEPGRGFDGGFDGGFDEAPKTRQRLAAASPLGGVKLESPFFEPDSVCGPPPPNILPRISVFDTSSYPSDAAAWPSPGPAAPPELPPGDIKEALSEPLLDEPVGLAPFASSIAFIAPAPHFERSDAIRIKRSVSGNRHKHLPADQGGPPPLAAAVAGANGFARPHDGAPPRPPQQPPLPTVGVFQGLPPRPSRELRSQSSLDRVAVWQQTRPPSNNSLGERLSKSILSLLEEEPSGSLDYEDSFEFDSLP